MMDVVWVYVNRGNQEELEYSIKSVKNIEHGRLIVIGDKPNFDVEHSKQPIVRWSMLSPTHDVISKLLHATTLDISDDFILMNDDFMIMMPTDIPVAHRGPLRDHHAGRRINDSYTKTLKTTYDYLVRKGIKDPLSYELHIPMVFNKQKLAKMYEEIIPLISHNSPMLTRSLYGNIYNIGGELMGDVKNPDSFEGYTFLSTNETTFNDKIGEYIRSKL